MIAEVYDNADPSRSLAFTATDGHITSITDFTGRTWSYTYATAANPNTDETTYFLASVTTPSDDSTPANTLSYTYSTSAPLFGLMTAITESSDSKSIQVGYYPNGQVFSVTDPEGNVQYFFYDSAHNSATYVNGDDQATVSEFDSNGFTIKQINPDLTQVKSTYSTSDELLSQTNAMGQTETFTYDSNGNITASTAFDGVTTDATYNSFAEPIEVTLPGSRITTYTYDSNGNMLSMTDAVGDETTFTYYSDGLAETVTAPNGNVSGAIPADFTTTYTYNAAGQVLTTTTGLPSAAVIVNTYDDQGDLTSTAHVVGNTTSFLTSYAYNLLGQLLSITGPNPDVNGVTGESQAVSSVTYVPSEDETITTDPNGNSTETFLNGNNQVVKVVNPDGSFVTYAYDAAGNLVAMTDAREHDEVRLQFHGAIDSNSEPRPRARDRREPRLRRRIMRTARSPARPTLMGTQPLIPINPTTGLHRSPTQIAASPPTHMTRSATWPVLPIPMGTLPLTPTTTMAGF